MNTFEEQSKIKETLDFYKLARHFFAWSGIAEKKASANLENENPDSCSSERYQTFQTDSIKITDMADEDNYEEIIRDFRTFNILPKVIDAWKEQATLSKKNK